jgi:NAD(P)-dependent dehydrogenase (short-subunit alcohol dehydrogenase family)
MAQTERRILVTGAASGIGAGACRAMAAPGVALAIHTRKNREGADRMAAWARERGARTVVILGDLADPTVPARVAAKAIEALGGLDVLVSNAGFADKTPFEKLDDAGFAKSHEAMPFAMLRLARAARPALMAGKDPRLVAVSSFVAHLFRTDTTLFPASAAAKAALEAMVRALAIEWAPKVAVNAVVPGYTRKDPGAHAALSEQQWAEIAGRIPMQRLGTPDDVGAAIAFLASPAAGYITGQCLHVSGGIVI